MPKLIKYLLMPYCIRSKYTILDGWQFLDRVYSSLEKVSVLQLLFSDPYDIEAESQHGKRLYHEPITAKN
jgi:hypothetical protein